MLLIYSCGWGEGGLFVMGFRERSEFYVNDLVYSDNVTGLVGSLTNQIKLKQQIALDETTWGM